MQFAAITNEGCFQIELTWNHSRRDSVPARHRWWQHYAAFPLAHQHVAGKRYELMQATRIERRAA